MSLLPPQVVAAQAQQAQALATTEANTYYNPTSPIVYAGKVYIPQWGDVWANGFAASSTLPSGYQVFDYDQAADSHPSLYNGRPYITIDANGVQTGSGILSGFTDSTFFEEFGPFIMVAAGFAAAVAAGAGAAAAAGGASSTASTAGGSGAFLGEGVSSGIPAWDVAGGSSGAFLGEGVASGVPAWDAAAASAGLPVTSGGFITEAASPASTAASTIAKSAPSLLSTAKTATGLVTTLLGLTHAGGGAQQTGPITAAPTGGNGFLSDLSNMTTGTALVLAAALGLVAYVAQG